MSGPFVPGGVVGSDDGLRDLAVKVVDALNRLVGTLHAVRCTAAFWIAHAEQPNFRFAAKYSLQMTFGTAMVTLRKFQDLQRGGHLERLLGSNDDVTALLAECERRHTRPAANLLHAHYAENVSDAPLSSEEILSIIERGGWASEEEFVEWIRPILNWLLRIRDEIVVRFRLPSVPLTKEDM
jgi:hypothetical protein